MKARATSLHAKLYSFTYPSQLPGNLCPYFWKLVIAFTLFIPNFILQLPSHIWGFIFKYDREDSCIDNLMKGAFFYVVITVILIFLHINYHFIKAIFNCYSYNSDVAIIGAYFDTAVLCIVLYVIISEWHKNKPKTYKEKTPNIIIEYVKAKKDKYCPKINWE